MTRTNFIVYLSLISCSFLRAQTSVESRPVKPLDAPVKVAVNLSGKSMNYYWLAKDKPAVLSVQGPGLLKVYTRIQLLPDMNEPTGYTLLYTIDGGEQEKREITGVEPSKQAEFADKSNGVPGELKTFELELQRGFHTITLSLEESGTRVAAKYTLTPSKVRKQEWIAFSPVLPSEPVDLISRESATAYYRFSIARPLKVDIIGPAELRVLTRTENHFQMKGRINYRVQVREDGQVISTYQLNSKVSEVAVYRDDKDLVPGTACEFVIFVPKGKHLYEIVPLDPDKSTLLGRLLIPKKDVSPGTR